MGNRNKNGHKDESGEECMFKEEKQYIFGKKTYHAKEMIAQSPAEAKVKLDELKALIDKWEKTLKEIAKAPAKPKATKSKK